jgi:intracellular multiplication protein IcmB
MSNAIVNGLNSLLAFISMMVKEPATSFCELETVDIDGKTLIAADGSLATIIELKGTMRMVGQAEYERLLMQLNETLKSFLKKPGRTMQVFWVRDPEGGADVVHAALEGPRAQAKLLHLDFEDLYDEKERELTKWVCHEAVYLVLWSHPGTLNSAELKAARAEQQASNEKYGDLSFMDVQNPRKALAALRNGHASFVTSLLTVMKQLNLAAEELDGHGALRAIRYTIDPSWTPPGWAAVIPGDRIPTKFAMREDESASVWWPPLKSQVWPRDAYVKGKFVEIGDRIHAPMYVDCPPSRVVPFDSLIKTARDLDKKMPFSVSFTLRGGGMKTMSLKNTLSSFLRVLAPFNGQISDAIRQLRELEKTEAIVGCQVAFNTWAPVGKDAETLLRKRATTMAQAMIDWGGAEVREDSGDPVEGFVSAALGLTPKSVASTAAAPLYDVLSLLPLTRPASPWGTGANLFTSVDGKLMPYQPGSSLQQTWNGIWVGGPGSGKSMSMFMQHLGTLVAPQGGVNKLPLLSVIDIGPSSSGLVSLLKYALPPNERSQVVHHRLRNTEEFAVNMFDPPLGMDRPLPETRARLVDMLTMLATPAETGVPYEGTSELAGAVLDIMYENLANTQRGNPRRYYALVDKRIDEALRARGLEVPEAASWYDIRDMLFKAGDIHSAHLASRQAAPLLSDVSKAARDARVMNQYGKKFTQGDNSETLPEAFARMIGAACREYKLLTQPTKFDVGESRVTVLDLDEVAKSGGVAADKQTAVMYALAMHILMRDFTTTKEDLRDIPELYRDYHYAKIQANEREMKTLCCDETHRLPQRFSTMIRERLKVVAREGRKWNIQMMLGSQRLADFDEELIEMCTSLFIMERPDESLVEEYAKRFGLTETERHNLTRHVHGPGPGGGCFFVRMKLKRGYFNQLLRNPAGPLELWAGGTTAEDKSIREIAYAALGPRAGRAALAMAYPEGSAKADVDQRKEQLILRGHTSGNSDNDVFDAIATEVITRYQEVRAAQLREEIETQQLAEARRQRVVEHMG